MQKSDAQPSLHELLSFADSAKALELKRTDCVVCNTCGSHLSRKATFWLVSMFALGGAAFGSGFVLMADNSESAVKASLSTLIFMSITALLAWQKVETRARIHAHAELNRRKSQAMRMASALLTYLEMAQDCLLSDQGVLGPNILGKPFDSFQQSASNKQMQLGESGDTEARSEMLSAIMHCRELNAKFEAYKRDGSVFMEAALECAVMLEMSAATENAPTNEPSVEFRDRCLMVYGKVSAWHDAIHVAAGDEGLIRDLKRNLNENFQHVEALVTLQRLLDSLPEVPFK